MSKQFKPLLLICCLTLSISAAESTKSRKKPVDPKSTQASEIVELKRQLVRTLAELAIAKERAAEARQEALIAKTEADAQRQRADDVRKIAAKERERAQVASKEAAKQANVARTATARADEIARREITARAKQESGPPKQPSSKKKSKKGKREKKKRQENKNDKGQEDLLKEVAQLKEQLAHAQYVAAMHQAFAAQQQAIAEKASARATELEKFFKAFRQQEERRAFPAKRADANLKPVKDIEIKRLRPGLQTMHFPRQASQEGKDEVWYVELDRLRKSVGLVGTTETLSPWHFPKDLNAIAIGYLRVPKTGEYAFKSYNFYDRNVLIVAGKTVCRYRDLDRGKPPRIRLKEGYVPIVSIGYVNSRGSVEVTWKLPGATELSPIPREFLFHLPSE